MGIFKEWFLGKESNIPRVFKSLYLEEHRNDRIYHDGLVNALDDLFYRLEKIEDLIKTGRILLRKLD